MVFNTTFNNISVIGGGKKYYPEKTRSVARAIGNLFYKEK
jgi:hypothetical protein